MKYDREIKGENFENLFKVVLKKEGLFVIGEFKKVFFLKGIIV